MSNDIKLIKDNITYRIGDATDPIIQVNQQTILAHVVNDAGGWGAGFSGALSKRYPMVETLYRHWHKEGHITLGVNQFISVKPQLIVANMCAQHKWFPQEDMPLKYEALADCLIDLHKFVKPFGSQCNIAMPRIGAGLAGGNWDTIEQMILETFTETPISVYDLE